MSQGITFVRNSLGGSLACLLILLAFVLMAAGTALAAATRSTSTHHDVESVVGRVRCCVVPGTLAASGRVKYAVEPDKQWDYQPHHRSETDREPELGNEGHSCILERHGAFRGAQQRGSLSVKPTDEDCQYLAAHGKSHPPARVATPSEP